jgi:glyoxylase-like metal-dependent hydrolase (beta-lactamase superfamily II)
MEATMPQDIKTITLPGNLALIVLAHGDFDHTGNGAYLRQKYGARMATHRDDLGMVERGDTFFSYPGHGSPFPMEGLVRKA